MNFRVFLQINTFKYAKHSNSKDIYGLWQRGSNHDKSLMANIPIANLFARRLKFADKFNLKGIARRSQSRVCIFLTVSNHQRTNIHRSINKSSLVSIGVPA